MGIGIGVAVVDTGVVVSIAAVDITTVYIAAVDIAVAVLKDKPS